MKTTPSMSRLSIALLAALSLSVTGCSTLKNFTNKKEDVLLHADKSEEGYYQEAQDAIAKERYSQAAIALNNLRTFYPSSRYAQQALLDLMYVYFQAGDYEAATNSTAQFMQAYPTHPNLDYALYVQGVTNMRGSPNMGRLFNLEQNQRNTAYLRLAFNDFQNLLVRYPNSVYAPDAAQRMTAIYNDLAEFELVAARWYIKREAYVAAANRAKWVFQYYPQSTAVPEAIALLAYSNEKLGLASTANDYKTLLQINYPQYISSSGQVLLPSQAKRSLVETLSFGILGRNKAKREDNSVPQYDGETRTQIIRAASLQLPKTAPAQPSTSSPITGTAPSTRPNIGLGLPKNDSETGNTNSAHSTAIEAATPSSR